MSPRGVGEEGSNKQRWQPQKWAHEPRTQYNLAFRTGDGTLIGGTDAQ
jgi:hypothetical protein